MSLSYWLFFGYNYYCVQQESTAEWPPLSTCSRCRFAGKDILSCIPADRLCGKSLIYTVGVGKWRWGMKGDRSAVRCAGQPRGHREHTAHRCNLCKEMLSARSWNDWGFIVCTKDVCKLRILRCLLNKASKSPSGFYRAYKNVNFYKLTVNRTVTRKACLLRSKFAQQSGHVAGVY